MNKHTFWMIIGCTVPLLLIFLLPLFGITGNYSFLIFIIAMFACHLLMPMHHGSHDHDAHKKYSETLKKDNNEPHQHYEINGYGQDEIIHNSISFFQKLK